jgi:hypothetical protein
MDRNWEQDASKQGWKPKEDFVAAGGNEETWVDAKVFVERGESSAPILKSKLEKSERKLADLQTTVESLTKHHNRMLTKEQEERKHLMAQLEDARAQAVADGDAKRFKQADQQLKRLEKVEENTPVQVPQSTDPEIDAWLEENQWYNDDEALQAMADGYAAKLKTRNPSLSGKALLDKVSEHVLGHVEKTKPKVKEKVVDEEEDRTPTTRTQERKSSKKGFSDLPAADRRECERLIKEIKGFTKEQFLEYYDWE